MVNYDLNRLQLTIIFRITRLFSLSEGSSLHFSFLQKRTDIDSVFTPRLCGCYVLHAHSTETRRHALDASLHVKNWK